MDGKNKRGRPKRRWTDDLADWCNKDICNLYGLAMDRNKWTHLVKYVVDTNGHWAHGATERERDGTYISVSVDVASIGQCKAKACVVTVKLFTFSLLHLTTVNCLIPRLWNALQTTTTATVEHTVFKKTPPGFLGFWIAGSKPGFLKANVVVTADEPRDACIYVYSCASAWRHSLRQWL